jgi:hypothetical protein
VAKRFKDDAKDNIIHQEVKRLLNETYDNKNISISFQYQITNDHYLPEGIRDKTVRLSFYTELLKKIRDITSFSWLELGKRRKNTGYEGIPLKVFSRGLRNTIEDIDIISSDSKLEVMRLGNDFRMIGKYLQGIFYIIAFDIDFSAYDHG